MRGEAQHAMQGFERKSKKIEPQIYYHAVLLDMRFLFTMWTEDFLSLNGSDNDDISGKWRVPLLTYTYFCHSNFVIIFVAIAGFLILKTYVLYIRISIGST